MHLQDKNIDVSLPQQLAHIARSIKDWVIVDLISLTKINVIVLLSYTLHRDTTGGLLKFLIACLKLLLIMVAAINCL